MLFKVRRGSDGCKIGGMPPTGSKGDPLCRRDYMLRKELIHAFSWLTGMKLIIRSGEIRVRHAAARLKSIKPTDINAARYLFNRWASSRLKTALRLRSYATLQRRSSQWR